MGGMTQQPASWKESHNLEGIIHIGNLKGITHTQEKPTTCKARTQLKQMKGPHAILDTSYVDHREIHTYITNL